MPTAIHPINKTWSAVANDSHSTVLITLTTSAAIEFATTDGGTAPTVTHGHILSGRDALTRTVIGPGTIWARIAAGDPATATNLVVTVDV